MTRDQLIETMARAVCGSTTFFVQPEWDSLEPVEKAIYRNAATYVLTAIEAAGMRVVPVEMMQALREETAALLERYDDHEQSNHPNVYVLIQRLDATVLAAQEDSTSE